MFVKEALRMSLFPLLRKVTYGHIFSKVTTAPPDQVFGMVIAFANDNDPRKINLGLGAYKNERLQPVVLDVVRKVEEQVASQKLNMEYIPIDGLPGFVKGSQHLIFGKEAGVLKDNRVATIQTLSGTGALRLGFDLIKEYYPTKVLVPEPTWPNHQRIIRHAGMKVDFYPYYDNESKKVDLKSLVGCLQKTEEGSIVLFQVCAHNPTATDPTPEEWKVIADAMEKRKLVPFFDSTYQGLASANFQKDIWAIRHFAERGFSMLVEQSYAKNMGMYGHRVGCLHVVTSDSTTAIKVLSQLKVMIRGCYSSPPVYGARIAERIVNSESLMSQWQGELVTMVARMDHVRKLLRNRLQELKTPGTWKHVTSQRGFFVFSGLSKKQCDYLFDKYHIHMMDNGRMAMIGLNAQNIEYVAQAINDAIVNVK